MVVPTHERTSFFKYYTADSAKLTLTNAARKWSTPQLFNDPFDNQFDLHWEEQSEERSRARVARFHDIVRSPIPIVENQFGDQTANLRLIQQTLCRNPEFQFTDDDITEMLESEMEGEQNVIAQTAEMNADVRRVLADTSIFCVSETHDNLLMWSHYALNHTGAVVEFLSLRAVDSPLILAQSVRYTNRIPPLKFDIFFDLEGAKLELINTVTLTKGDDWAYEKEWRVVTTLRDKTQPFEIISFARDEVAAVYIGCRMTPEDKAELTGITRLGYPRAKILEAAKHDHEFALTFHEVG